MKNIVLAGAVALVVLPILSAPASATETITYTYDVKGRLIMVVHSGTINNGVSVRYTHDHADNRTNVTVTGAP